MTNLTLEIANKIVEENDSFYYKDEEINDETFRIFNYRLISYSDWLTNNEIDINKLEMRGLCFNLKTKERFLGLHKFFNFNENPISDNTLYEWKEDDKYEVMEKLDGSLILPTLVNNEIILRTKGSFKSEQSKLANKFMNENQNYYEFITECFEMNMYPIFELIGWKNQIVISYEEEYELRLIQIRDKNSDYLCYNVLKELSDKYNIKIAKKYSYTLSELEKLQETEKGIEGWIVHNLKAPLKYQFRKYKTSEYFLLHKLLSPSELVENKLIEHILNETIDDILSNLNENKKDSILEIVNKVNHFYNNKYNECLKLIKEKDNSDKKEFVLKYKDFDYFGLVMKSNENTLDKNLKKYILKMTSKLEKSRKFLNKI